MAAASGRRRNQGLTIAEDCQFLVGERFDQGEVNAGIGEGGPEAQDEGQFPVVEVEAGGGQRPGEVVAGMFTEGGVAHRVLGQPLEEVNPNLVRVCGPAVHVSTKAAAAVRGRCGHCTPMLMATQRLWAMRVCVSVLGALP